MAISETRMIALLDALGDALDALRQVQDLVRNAGARVDSGADPGGELQSLVIMTQPDLLLRQPIETRLALERERAYWTPTRRAANERRRKRLAQREAAPPLTDEYLEGLLNRKDQDE